MDIFLPICEIKEIGPIDQLSDHYGWGLKDLQIPESWAETQGEDVVVMVIDSGLSNHPDLDGNELKIASKSFLKESVLDKQGHGSHVNGIIGSKINSTGIVGVAPKAKIISVKVLNKHGRTDDSILKKALEYAIKIKPDIINLSLGSYAKQTELEPLYKKIIFELNIPIVCAAGNEGKKGVMYPAKYPYTISVGSYKEGRTLSEFSAFENVNDVDFVAPGDEILSTYLDKKYAVMSGTSMAAPFVSGILALLISKYKKNGRSYTVEELRSLLTSASIDVGKVGRDNKFGNGIINLQRALREIEGNGLTDIIPNKNKNWIDNLKEKIKK